MTIQKALIEDSASVMPDGKRYKGMRGGNWYNGDMIGTVNDGHSRVSNRNPSYFRGPLDPNNPWYHIGFRVVRNEIGNTTGIDKLNKSLPDGKLSSYPNPFKNTTNIQFTILKPEQVSVKVYNSFGQLVATIFEGKLSDGLHCYQWNACNNLSGIYYCNLQLDNQTLTQKIILIK